MEEDEKHIRLFKLISILKVKKNRILGLPCQLFLVVCLEQRDSDLKPELLVLVDNLENISSRRQPREY